jgi:hypothetical protein
MEQQPLSKIGIEIKDGGFHYLTFEGERLKPHVTTDYVAQQSVWLVVMRATIGDFWFNGCEYLYSLDDIGLPIFESMVRQMQEQLDGGRGNEFTIN